MRDRPHGHRARWQGGRAAPVPSPARRRVAGGRRPAARHRPGARAPRRRGHVHLPRARAVPPGCPGAAVAGRQEAAGEYLNLRRALGCQLRQPGQLLMDFAARLDQAGADHLQVTAALAWATEPEDVTSYWHWYRLLAVRGFSRYLHALDCRNEIVPAGALPHRYTRAVPYIFTTAEIAALMRAAAGLPRRLPAATYQALIGLLTATGLFSRGRHPKRRSDPHVCPAQRLVVTTLPGATRVVQVCQRRVVALMWLSCVMSSRLAARAALRSWSRSSSWSCRSAACCSRWVIFWWRASMSAGAPSPDSRQACSPSASESRFSSWRVRAVSRRARSWAARRSACRDARVTPGPGVPVPAGGAASRAWIFSSRSRWR